MIGNNAEELMQMMVALADERQIEGVLDKVVDTLLSLTHADGARALVLDYAGRVLHCSHARFSGLDASNSGIDPVSIYRSGTSSINFEDANVFALISRKIVNIENARRHSGFKLSAMLQKDREAGIDVESLAIVPLRTRDNKSIGVLQLINLRDRPRGTAIGLSSQIEPVVKSVAAYLSISLSNARLFEENRNLIQQLDRMNRQLKEENKRLRDRIETVPQPTGIIGASTPLKQVLKLAGRAARTKVPVLILGETGTGKEMLARAIHTASPRRDKPFVVQNCAALPENLLESELFGHVKGAFTGATADKNGLIVEAHNGTLFLDEIGDMPIGLQAKILRFLQEEEVRPIGSTRTSKVDVRIVAATHQDLPVRIHEGLFREDLYYRLSVFPVTLPALRERPSDINLLVQHFLERACESFGRSVPLISKGAFEALTRWRYPGNIRELKNIVERAVLMSDEGDAIGPEHLPPQMTGGMHGNPFDDPDGGADGDTADLRSIVGRYEARIIEAKLREEGWNQSRCAERLGVSRRALIDKINRYGIRRPEAARDAVDAS